MNRSCPSAPSRRSSAPAESRHGVPERGGEHQGVRGVPQAHEGGAGKVLGKVVDNVVGVVQGPFPGVWSGRRRTEKRTQSMWTFPEVFFSGQFIRLATWRTSPPAVSDLNRVDVSRFRSGTPSVSGVRRRKDGDRPVGPDCAYCVKLHGSSGSCGEGCGRGVPRDAVPEEQERPGTYQNACVVCSKSEKLLDDAYTGRSFRGHLQVRRGGRTIRSPSGSGSRGRRR